MKFFKAWVDSKKHTDDVQSDRYDYNKVKSAIEATCEKYLRGSDDILTIEIMPNVLDWALSYLTSEEFLENYEFSQVNETLFKVKLKEIDLI